MVVSSRGGGTSVPNWKVAGSKGNRKKQLLDPQVRITTEEKWNKSEPVPGELKCEGILHPHGRDSNTYRGRAASCELHVLRLWRQETYEGHKTAMNCWKQNPFISKQDSFETTLQEQTPKTILKNYVNCATQGCQGTLYHPSPECALWSLVFQWSQGAQIMIKDFHLWPWDVKSPVHSYDLRRTNCKVIIDRASFKASHPQW